MLIMREELSHVSIQLVFMIFHPYQVDISIIPYWKSYVLMVRHRLMRLKTVYLPNEGYNNGRGFDNQRLPC